MTSTSCFWEESLDDESNDDVCVITGLEQVDCPDCKTSMRSHGRCFRYICFPAQDRTKLSLRVFFCSDCRHYHRELPDFIVPYKQQCVETIEKIYASPMESVYADIEESTIRRIRKWVLSFLKCAVPIIGGLSNLTFTETGNQRIIKTYIRMIVGANKWHLISSPVS